MKEIITIENAIMKPKKNGDKYLAVSSDKGWFSVFDEDVADELINLRGVVSVEYTEKNGFKTIVGFEPYKTAPGAVSMLPIAHNIKALDKDRLIVRQSCLKAAVEVFNQENIEGDIIKTLELAEKFENWVFR